MPIALECRWRSDSTVPSRVTFYNAERKATKMVFYEDGKIKETRNLTAE